MITTFAVRKKRRRRKVHYEDLLAGREEQAGRVVVVTRGLIPANICRAKDIGVGETRETGKGVEGEEEDIGTGFQSTRQDEDEDESLPTSTTTLPTDVVGRGAECGATANF